VACIFFIQAGFADSSAMSMPGASEASTRSLPGDIMAEPYSPAATSSSSPSSLSAAITRMRPSRPPRPLAEGDGVCTVLPMAPLFSPIPAPTPAPAPVPPNPDLSAFTSLLFVAGPHERFGLFICGRSEREGCFSEGTKLDSTLTKRRVSPSLIPLRGVAAPMRLPLIATEAG
jgi:hypothetical protein